MNSLVTKDRPGVIAPPPLIYLATFALGYFLQRQFPFGLQGHFALNATGWILIALSMILMVTGILAMKRAQTHVNVSKPTKAIVIDGPFRFSRNPLYISLTALYLGVALLKLMLWPLIMLPSALLIMHYGVIKREERYLAMKFGEEYLRYQARVRRWL